MSQRRVSHIIARTCIFAGPSLSRLERPEGIDLFPPATRGSIREAVGAGYRVIGFIDGAVDPKERVSLAELRDALARRAVRLIGGASMGAIRAVQLDTLGMLGIGRVFRLFRRGSLSDADEVLVLHAPAALRFRPLTLPLVNIRYTLQRMRTAEHITPADEAGVIAHLSDVPWFDRDRQSLSAAVYRTCGSARSARVVQWFDRLYRDVKQEDAIGVVSAVRRHMHSSQRSRAIGAVGDRPFAVRRA